MRSILILLTINILVVQSILGQKATSEDGVIMGKIVDQQTGKALEYVSVKVFKAADSSIVSGAFTTVDGKYSIPCQFGSYYLKISFTNYDPILVSAITVKTALPIFGLFVRKVYTNRNLGYKTGLFPRKKFPLPSCPTRLPKKITDSTAQLTEPGEPVQEELILE
jgi:hypothetical protein